MQAAIYCTLKNKGQTAYTVNEKLIDEVIECYAQSFPLNDKIPTHIQIKKMLKMTTRFISLLMALAMLAALPPR